jgi:integrase
VFGNPYTGAEKGQSVTKRANNDGGLYRRMRDGRVWRYEASFYYDDPTTGQRKRHTSYARTRQAALNAMKQARERLAAGGPIRDAKVPLAQWLAHWRETTLAASDRKPATKALYATLCRRWLEPAPFGANRVDKLRPSDIDGLLLALRAATKTAAGADSEQPGRRALSDSTIRQIYTVLRAALDGAVRDGLLARNPAASVARPGVERREAAHLAAGDVSALLRAAEPSRYHAALELIARTGLRRGEALALRWQHVDLDAGLLRVVATIGRVDGELLITEPKTERSRRAVPLSPAAVELLRDHQAKQDAERRLVGDAWLDAAGLVFTTGTAPVDPRNLLRAAEAAAKRAGLDGVGVHTLRHSAAVAWLESGVHIKAVADLLGHSSISITGDVYGHTSDDAARAAVEALDVALGR